MPHIRYTEKESELCAVFYRYLLNKHDKVRMEVGDMDLVAYGPGHRTTSYELKIKDWKSLFRQMGYAQLLCDNVYGVMPKEHAHLAVRNWDKAPVGCGLYEVDTKQNMVREIYACLDLDPMTNAETRNLISFMVCLGRPPYR